MMSTKLKDMTIDQLVEHFAEIGLAQHRALIDDDHSKFSRLYRDMDELDNELRTRGPAARLSLLRLFGHSNDQVRLKAAVRTLAVAPERARQTLEDIAASERYPQAGDAGMIIAGLDNGSFKPT